MNTHHGQIVEHFIRKNGFNINRLASELGVNRRSIYNWFSCQQLKPSIIYKIGVIIRHDFSLELPEVMKNYSFEVDQTIAIAKGINSQANPITESYKDKYVSLLEDYNKMLLDSLRESEWLNTSNNKIGN